MNKNIIGLLFGIIILLSVGSAHAALSIGAWTANNATSLSINTGDSAEFDYGITAVTALGGQYSIMLYQNGNTNPIYTYANQATVGNSAKGTFTVTPTHYSSTAGNYYVIIKSEDTIGRDSYRLNLNVVNGSPSNNIVASCTATPTTGDAPLNVQFSSVVTGGTGTYTYQWTFGDGNTGNGNIAASHVYSNGTYNASLSITDSANTVKTVSCGQIVVNKVIIQPDVLKTVCVASPLSGTVPYNVAFVSQTSGGIAPYKYEWNFGDGTVLNNSYKNILAYTYAKSGVYPTSLRVFDANNNIADANCGIVNAAAQVSSTLTASCSATPTTGNTSSNIQFSSAVSGGTGTYTYQWTFGDGIISNTPNKVSHVYTSTNTYNSTLRIIDSANNVYTANCGQIIITTPVVPIIDIDSLNCFSRITDGGNQSCSVFVKSNGQAVGNANVNIYYTNGVLFGSCITDKLSGGCEVKKEIYGVGNYTVYATANALGFIGDNDKQPQFTFAVFTQRYDILNLGTYSDRNFVNPSDTFYRGQPLYIKFQVYDDINKVFVTSDIVTAASLVSLPGGRVDLSKINYNGNWYYYSLDAIPLTHDFLGDSNVFAFAFNFTGLTSGQAQVSLTILNNKPTISNIADVYVNVGQSYSISLNNYGSDLEDHTLLWNITNTPTLFTANIMSGNVLSITGVSSGDSVLALRGYDLDNDYADTIINVHVLGGILPTTLITSCIALPNSGNAPLTVAFTMHVNNGVGPYTYELVHGDGTSQTLPNSLFSTNTLVNIYTSSGVYTPTLTVTDSQGNTGNSNCGFVVVGSGNNSFPVASTGGPYRGYITEPVTFDASLSTGNIVNYRWDFGDASGLFDSNSPVTTHVYAKVGIYTVRLIVFDINGYTVGAQTTATIIEHTNNENVTIRNVPDKGIVIQHLLIYGQNGEIIKSNDDLQTQISLKNAWGTKLHNVQVIISIPELGLETISSSFDMSNNAEIDKSLDLELYDVAPGAYEVKISVDSDDGSNQVRRIKYREIIVEK